MKIITLTPKQQRFCDEYLVDLNATKAALRAGYSGGTALNGKLMAIPKIRYYLQQRTEAAVEKAKVNHDMILSELCKIAFGNMGNYFTANGTMKPMQDLTADEKAALWSVTVTEGSGVTVSSTTRIKMNNKMAALDKLAKHLKFYDAEEKQPEVVYVYIDKDNADDHDRFDDELFYDEDDDDGYYDEDDEDYFKYDTECRVAIAKAKEAFKARRKADGGGQKAEEEIEEEFEEEEGPMSESPEVRKMKEGPKPDFSKMTVAQMTQRIMNSQVGTVTEEEMEFFKQAKAKKEAREADEYYIPFPRTKAERERYT